MLFFADKAAVEVCILGNPRYEDISLFNDYLCAKSKAILSSLMIDEITFSLKTRTSVYVDITAIYVEVIVTKRFPVFSPNLARVFKLRAEKELSSCGVGGICDLSNDAIIFKDPKFKELVEKLKLEKEKV